MAKTKIDVVDIRHHAGPMLLPEGLSTKDAISALQRKLIYDEQTFTVNAEFDCFIYEGAYALNEVLTEQYGWVGAQTKVIDMGFLGKEYIPPTMLNVPVDLGVVIQVPWGQFQIPSIDGYIECSFAVQGASGRGTGRMVFAITGEVKRKDEAKVKKLVEAVEAQLKKRSIYQNKSFRLRMLDDNGRWLQEPLLNFLQLDDKLEDELVLAERVERAVKVNLFTPIERTAEVRRAGVPLKRGVLLAGPYGTGKTMIASVTALKAKRNGWTYIVCERADELSHIIRLARRYQPCVVFCEDIDRIVTGERSEEMDHILNVIDGVEAKGAELMIVLTTNDMESINPALLRPGRLDSIVLVSPPDAQAAERLARQYARGLIPEDEPLERAPDLLAGKISSVIREVTERSKLAAVGFSQPGEAIRITDDALVEATLDMEDHIRAATPPQPDKRSDIEKAADSIAAAINPDKAPENGKVRPEVATR